MSESVEEIINRLKKEKWLDRLATQVYERMKELHDRECNSVCFTQVDVLLKLAEDFGEIPKAPVNWEGNSVEWYGTWGNVAFDHFMHFYWLAREKYHLLG
jgi:hypothetical protein